MVEYFHVAIIPDGNRRWAKEKGFEITKGHEVSTRFEKLNELLKECVALKITHFSIWGFSTENWNRSGFEKKFLFGLIEKLLSEISENVANEKFRLIHIGRKDRLPKNILDSLEEIERKTSENKGVCLQIFLDYGGRDEIIRAVSKVALSGEKINEKSFSDFLDTSGVPFPDLVIRTGGEKRLSGFMPFQTAYAELYFTDIYFPDFGVKEFRESVDWFRKRERRFGK